MHLFSTVLFVNGNPVGYTVSREDRTRLVLNPAENPDRSIEPPVLRVAALNGELQIEGTTDRDLIDQVVEDVTLHEAVPRQALSAAP